MARKSSKDGLKAEVGDVSTKKSGEQTPKDLELASYVNKVYIRELERQRREHPTWYLALSFLSGKQWVYYNDRSNVVDEIPRMSATDRRLTLNRIRPISESVLSQVTASDPKWIMAPNFTSESGYISARGWQQWYDWIWRTKNLERVVRDQVLLWAVVTGRGWMRITWDGGGGKKRTVRIPVEPDLKKPDETAGEILDMLASETTDISVFGEDVEDAIKEYEEELVPEGDFVFKSCSPFNVFIDPSAEDIQNIRWLVEVSYVSRQEVEELYGVEVVGDIEPASTVTNYTQRVRRGVRSHGDLSSSGSGSIVGMNGDKYVAGVGLYGEDDFDNMVLLKEMWVAPNKEYPEGRYVVVANNKVLREGDNPYGRIPYIPFTWHPRQGSTYADGLVPALVDLQKELNRSFSRLSVNMLIHSSPPWLVDVRSDIDLNAFTDRPNGIIMHKTPLGGMPPTRSSPPNLTSNSMAYLSMINQQMEEVAGLHAADKGINPSGSRSSTMIEQLRNASLQTRKPAISRYKESLQDAAQLILEITRRYVKEDRLVPVIGKDGTVVVTEFTRQDIENGYDVRVMVGGGLPEDPLVRGDYLLSLVRAGIYKMEDDEDRHILQRQLEFGDVRSYYDDDSTTERLRVHAEDLEMLSGVPVEVKEYDMHKLHAETHTRFMRSPEAQAAFKANPGLEDLHRAHKDTHLDWLSAGNAEVPFQTGSGTMIASAPGQPAPSVGGEGGRPGMLEGQGMLPPELQGLLRPPAAS